MSCNFLYPMELRPESILSLYYLGRGNKINLCPSVIIRYRVVSRRGEYRQKSLEATIKTLVNGTKSKSLMALDHSNGAKVIVKWVYT